ncbi:MAG TPA: UDP-N-acetylmuramoyl-tripeptide--D-alanyl-D-alanine ligase [Thermoanaerobacterales bacterium]|nr:UDP-N-acetylmuramoyl-tripeptide--D-alanyl-D-alanine ligase [Thermoanaerobacterales bacterium]
MIPLNIEEVVKATAGFISGTSKGVIKGVSTDSRNIKSGELFVPLSGENFDGHEFIKEAIKKGAAAALCEIRKKGKVDLQGEIGPIIYVDNTQRALLLLAKYYRGLFNIPFVAVTGSVGKTTTKNMIAEILQTRFKVLKTEGNFNNEIGLPLTLFGLEKHHQIGVVEMGMSGFGEISRLAEIVNPSVSVITNIGVSHIEKLGSRQNIARAKMEILEPLKKDDLAVLDADSPELWEKRDDIIPRTVYFGLERGDVRVRDIESCGNMGIKFQIYGKYGEMVFEVPLPGKHNAKNALAALTVGFELGLSQEEIKKGFSKLKPSKMRMEYKKSRTGAIIIDDAYNASPDSMKAALDMLAESGKGKRKAAILGDMRELGDYAKTAHRDVGRYAADKTDILVTIGDFSDDMAEGFCEKRSDTKCLFKYNSTKSAVKDIEKIVEDCDIILIKASRAMKLEEITEALMGVLD